MIELLCTLTGIIAGIAVVASLMQQNGERQRFEAQPDDNGSDKIRGIADQLQVISHRVAADVNAHTEKVEHFSGRLAEPHDRPEKILSTINEIISANQSMQGQLVDAQKRIAQQSRMIEQASKQARTDALTGLANRRALDEFLTNCIESKDKNECVGLLLMDIDHFKSFNDNFGHTTGDAVLASFARAISECSGEECYAARFGGEEFAVILTGSNTDNLLAKAAQLRYYASEQVISYEDLQLKITASAGLCMLMPDDILSGIYERADEGLYQSKKAGRNCGHWLSENGWQPFPKQSGDPMLLSELRKNSDQTEDESQSNSVASTPLQPVLKPVPAAESAPPPAAAEPKAAAPSPPATPQPAATPSTAKKKEANEIFDLQTFLTRLEAYLNQLRKADLPAAAIMVEAIGLKEMPQAQAVEGWNEVVELVQETLRGIDIVCLYRPFTLCIFMPGCSLDVGIDRSAKIQQLMLRRKSQWPDSAGCPERFAISVAGVGKAEINAEFLNRLECTLEEALDASATEIVIHNGESCHFQEV